MRRLSIDSLLKITISCGKQGLALRGHRDHKIDWQASEAGNQDNFAQLVRFRIETDPVMAECLQEAPKNTRYTSKTIQNELVTVVGDRIRESIINKVKDVKFYSIVTDEVTNVSNTEELSLVVRYLYNKPRWAACLRRALLKPA